MGESDARRGCAAESQHKFRLQAKTSQDRAAIHDQDDKLGAKFLVPSLLAENALRKVLCGVCVCLCLCACVCVSLSLSPSLFLSFICVCCRSFKILAPLLPLVEGPKMT